MDLINIFWVWVGAAIGLVMGALPGLTVTMTVVLVVSLTFGWEMMQALAFILGAFTGAVTGGSLSAITMNIPGTAAAVATTFDGYPLHRRGQTTDAISTAFFVSLIGGVGGSLVLAILAPILGGSCPPVRFPGILSHYSVGPHPGLRPEQGGLFQGDDRRVHRALYRHDRDGPHYGPHAVYL